MTARLPLPLAFLLAALAGLLVLGTSAMVLVPDRAMDRMQLVIAPHPDDELLAFPALEDAPGTYTVVVSLTRGEATRRCDALERHLQQEAGERPPDPQPAGAGTPECGQARRDSWLAFLDAAGGLTREVRLGPGRLTEVTTLQDERFGGVGEVWRGRDAGWVMLSLPDGGLDEDQVVSAVDGLLGLRGSTLPDLPVQRVILASYVRPAQPGDPSGAGLVYTHPDHEVTTSAAAAVARLTGAETWVTVPWDHTPASRDIDTAGLDRVTRALPVQTYEDYLALGPPSPGGRPQTRLGAVQVAYGWLAFPGQAWSAGERPQQDTGVLLARTQDYLIVPVP